MPSSAPRENNIRQHTVPRFYLNGFSATADKRVYVRQRRGTTYGPVSTRSLAVENHAFTIINEGVPDDSCDGVNTAIETRIARSVQSLSPGKEVTKEEWVALLFLTANLLARSRRTRDSLTESIQWAACIAEDAAPILPSNLATAPGDINRVAEVLYGLMAAGGTVSLVRALKAKGCDLLTAPAGSGFVTSDDPAIVYVGGQLGMLELRPGFVERQDVEVFIALKPSMAVHWHSPSKCEAREISAEDVARWNQDVYTASYTAAYSNCRASLDALSPLPNA